jgi:iron complex transport system ATP-binding protein
MINLLTAGVRFQNRWIFRDLDLAVEPGTSLAVLGPNGRGKTTLIRALIGAQPLSEGMREAPSLIGYVPQVGAIMPYTVLDMVVMGAARRLGAFGSPAREDYAAARAAIVRVGLSSLSTQPFSLISGGERQLVLLARALVTGARTIVLDEPASALDLANQHELLCILNELRSREGYTIVFSTHLPQHALLASDETLLLLPGGEMLQGASVSILSEANLERTYGVPVRRLPMAGQADAIIPLLDSPGLAGATSHQRKDQHG